MTTTDLKTGDIVQHHRKGRGYVLRHGEGGSVRVIYASQARPLGFDLDLDTDGWERVETCTADAVRILEDYQQIVSKSAGVVVRDAVVMMTTAAYESYRGREIVKPGHVQVRVDDLDPQTLSEWSQYTVHSDCDSVLVRTGRAFIGQQVEYNPRCPKHAEKPTSATVTLPCPDCGEAIVRTARVYTDGQRYRSLVWATLGLHTCPPPQTDEPTEFGAKVSVTLGGGEIERFISCGDGWILTNPSTPNFQSQPWHWDYLVERGTVSLGWGDES